MGAGGVAGAFGWFVSYPFDIFKTIIQSSEHQKLTIKQVALELYRKEGFLAFYKGYSTTAFRSFISNAVTLPLFDYLNANFVAVHN
jgi:solute carrier family 25 carnitine/acylcarnitine transporter 20/29